MTESVAAPEGFRSSQARTRHGAWWWRTFGWLSSVHLAALLIGTLAIVVFIATWYEKSYGSIAANRAIYQAWWFDCMFYLLALNIAGAAIVRWPWSKRHVGFVIVHSGLLTLIAAFMIGGHDRLDGLMEMSPGQTASTVDLPKDRISIILPPNHSSSSAVIVDPFRVGGFPSIATFVARKLGALPDVPIGIHQGVFATLSDEDLHGIGVRLVGVCLPAAKTPTWGDAGDQAGAVPRLRVAVALRTPQAPTFATELDEWTVPGHDQLLTTGEMRGSSLLRVMTAHLREPASIAAFTDPTPVSATHGEVVFAWRGVSRRVVIDPQKLPLEIALSATLAVRLDRYLSHALMSHSGPVDNLDGEENPLLLFSYAEGEVGQRAWKLSGALARIPMSAINPGAPEAVLLHPCLFRPDPRPSMGIEAMLVSSDDGRAHLRWWSRSKGFQGVRSFASGEHAVDLLGGPNMPMTIRMNLTWLPKARMQPQPLPLKPERYEQATPWYELEARTATGQRVRQWFARGTTDSLRIDDLKVLVKVQQAQYDIRERHGFAVRLDRHAQLRDPGGSSIAGYTSTVTVLPLTGTSESRTTVMNEPVEYNGVQLFQNTSFPLIDAKGQPSGEYGVVFTAAHDAGLLLKYLGTSILIIGLLQIFFRVFTTPAWPHRCAAVLTVASLLFLLFWV